LHPAIDRELQHGATIGGARVRRREREQQARDECADDRSVNGMARHAKASRLEPGI
jgi:hypothetical protein